MEDQFTIRQVVGITKDILGNIELKGSEIERIGLPIGEAIHNLQAVCDAIDKSEPEPETESVEPEFIPAPEKTAE